MSSTDLCIIIQKLHNILISHNGVNVLQSILLLIFGFFLISKGSDLFIDETIWIAKVLKIPNIVIGATLVSFGTTLPEVMVSTNSALNGYTDMAFGNAVGSIAVNTGFILSLSIILASPNLKNKKKLIRTGSFLLFIIVLLIGITAVYGEISQITGFMFLAILAVYIFYNVKNVRASATELIEDEHLDKSAKSFAKHIILLLIGLTGTVLGSNLLVTNAEVIARMIGVSELVIGLTVTAFGTSLPELVTSITAIRKGAHDISIGNVLGANILNILLVLGISSTIKPIIASREYFVFHVPYVFIIVSLVMIFSVLNKKKLHRWNGALMLATYLVYITLLFI